MGDFYGMPIAVQNGGYACPEPQQGLTSERDGVRGARTTPSAEYLPVLGTYLIVDSTAQNNQFGIMPSPERGRFKRANVHL